MSKLAQKMLEWEQLMKAAAKLAQEIESDVFALGRTQTVGNVRATYSDGRKTYDYMSAAIDNDVPASIIEKHMNPPTFDWRRICIEAGVENIPFAQSAPYVKLKLLED